MWGGEENMWAIFQGGSPPPHQMEEKGGGEHSFKIVTYCTCKAWCHCVSIHAAGVILLI